MPPSLHWSSTSKRAFGKSGAEQGDLWQKKVCITLRVTFVNHVPGVPRLLFSDPRQVNLRAFRSCWQSHHSGGLRPTRKSSLCFRSRLCHWGLGLPSYPMLIGQKIKDSLSLELRLQQSTMLSILRGCWGGSNSRSPHCCGKHFRLTISLALTFPVSDVHIIRLTVCKAFPQAFQAAVLTKRMYFSLEIPLKISLHSCEY